MLKDLYIKNIATIDELRVTFERGFQVLTGETGAGKTILVEAIGLILGNKADAGLIRDGEEAALVEASFDIAGLGHLKELLEERGFMSLEDKDEVLIKRRLVRSGKNQIFVNHQKASLGLIKEICGVLFDFTGQNEQIRLLDSRNDIHVLDSFIPDPAVLSAYQRQFAVAKRAHEEVVAFKEKAALKEERLEWLRFKLRDFEALKIRSEEEYDDLKRRRERLKNAAAIADFMNLAAASLTDGSGSCVGLLNTLKDRLQKNAALRDMYAAVLRELDDIRVRLEDLSFEIARQGRGVDGEENLELDEIERRLYQVERLKQKHGPEISDVLQTGEAMRAEMAALQQADRNLVSLQNRFQEEFGVLKGLAIRLSRARQKTGLVLEKRIQKELASLLMPGVRFAIRQETAALDDFTSYTSQGVDRISFLISPNPGLSLKPLARIASGGETSRIFLALKQVLAKSRAGGSLIFDEIDSGISGAAVEIVGRKLKTLARSFQVFCVTHHAQIASQADRHYVVEKLKDRKSTITRVRPLSDEERVREVARLMGGVTITKKNEDYARELLGRLGGKEKKTW